MTKVMSTRLWGYLSYLARMSNGKPTKYHRVPNKRVVLKEKIKAVNQIIKANQDENLYQLIDLYSIFIDDDGLLKNDLSIDETHLNEQGYDAWVKFIQPIFILPKR